VTSARGRKRVVSDDRPKDTWSWSGDDRVGVRVLGEPVALGVPVRASPSRAMLQWRAARVRRSSATRRRAVPIVTNRVLAELERRAGRSAFEVR
jgi:hypothetical protein